MVQSGLQLGWSEFTNQTADYLEIGRESDPGSPSVWSSDDADRLDEYVQAGYRWSLWPGPSAGLAHRWSFMVTQVGSLVTKAGAGDYQLPAYVGGIEGSLTFSPDHGFIEIPEVSADIIRQRRQIDAGTTRPRMFALVPIAHTQIGNVAQVYQVQFWPTPDSVYTLGYSYTPIPEKLSSTRPYPIGGAPFSEVVLQGCLAVAELRRLKTRGEQFELFLERLRAGIDNDRRSRNPGSLGYNSNRTSRSRHNLRDYLRRMYPITVTRS